MNPSKVQRRNTKKLTDLPNVGPAMARDLELIGVKVPADLEDQDPFELYKLLCERTEARHDPCVLDIFMSITDYVVGNEPRPWWAYTRERKKRYGHILSVGRSR
jgi:hypothetical protein